MKKLSSAIALLAALSSTSTFAAEAGSHIIKFGAGLANYNSESTELSDDMGMGTALTPAGVTAVAEDHSVTLITYDYFLTDNWSVQFAAGTPPTVQQTAAGTGAALGKVGETKAMTPAVIGLYHFDLGNKLSAYVGAGVNYTKFMDVEIYESYEHAFGGESKGSIDDSVGGVVKVGANYALTDKWSVDLAYSRYWITSDIEVTTDTPIQGMGNVDVARNISIDVDPDIYSLTVGYQF